MLYRPSQAADIPAMARIRAREWGSFDYWTSRIAGYLEGESNPQRALPPRTCYVAVDESSVVGFVAGHLTRRYDCEGELEWINVIPERRGAGIASELLRLLAGWFVEQKALRVCVDVEPSNAVARAFYARHRAETLNEHWLVWNDISKVTASLR
jgi:ribosomal protein S18 acetylase RimI-like enzyme